MTAGPVASSLQHEIERFLSQEARLLDEQRFDEWLDLLADDIRYVLPAPEIMPGKPRSFDEDDVSLAYFDEDKFDLTIRVKQLETGLRHVEVPASITQRLITNVLVDPTDTPDEILARSSFLIVQIRHTTHVAQFTGRRDDRLRRVDGQWKLARRTIRLTETVLPRTLSIFF